MNAEGRERDGGMNVNFSGEGKGSIKGELELRRYPDIDVRCDEKREGIHRAVGQHEGNLQRPNLSWTGYDEGP